MLIRRLDKGSEGERRSGERHSGEKHSSEGAVLVRPVFTTRLGVSGPQHEE